MFSHMSYHVLWLWKKYHFGSQKLLRPWTYFYKQLSNWLNFPLWEHSHHFSFICCRWRICGCCLEKACSIIKHFWSYWRKVWKAARKPYWSLANIQLPILKANHKRGWSRTDLGSLYQHWGHLICVPNTSVFHKNKKLNKASWILNRNILTR